MFSRFSVQKAAGRNFVVALNSRYATSNAAASSSGKEPLRDEVNFPRIPILDAPPPVRVGIFPDHWFTNFYEKTGVLGPYMFMTSVSLTLINKEIFVLDHDSPVAIAWLILGTYVVVNHGDKIKNFFHTASKTDSQELDGVREDKIKSFQSQVEAEKEAQIVESRFEDIAEIQKESVALQLEAEYRKRMFEAYQQVKQRLDYQLELTKTVRQIEEKHMANWIMDSVKKSITPKHEDDALKKCISDLKKLAASQ